MRAFIALVAAVVFSACGGSRAVTVTPSTPPDSPAQRLRADLAAIFEAPQFDHLFWGVLVGPAGPGESLYALNAGKLMMPGSTMKIVTLASAAELLGWDHRFETKIVSAAPVAEGILRGDLVVVGGGDPSISERSENPGVLRLLARRLRESGITRIDGNIVGDDDLFDDNGLGDGWTLDNLPYGYSAAVSALEYNEGSVDLVIRAGAAEGDPVVIQLRPEGSGLEIDNRLATVAPSGTGRLTLRRLPGSSRVRVDGQIPAGAAPFARTASVDNPTAFFVAAFRAALIAEGVEVGGIAVDIDDLPAKPELAAAPALVSHQSPPLRQLAAAMMRVSQNQYAEMLLKSIGGREKAQAVLKSWGAGGASLVMADGSGLSRYNYVSAEGLVRILLQMHTDAKHASAFAETLPITGRDGTLSKRLGGTAAEGRVRAKTGTVDNVRAIAGYIDTAGGETLIFSIIANNFTMSPSVIDAAADKALVRLATFSRQQ